MHKIFYSISKQSGQTFPTKFENENRNKTYFLARYSLMHILKKKFDINFELANFELHDYSKIRQRPQFTASVAHTKDIAVVILGLKSEVSALGIDIEFESRAMKQGSDRFFINDQDKLSHSQLDTWCAKEACFKALSNYGFPITLLKEVVLSDSTFYFEKEKGQTFPYSILKKNGLIIAIAVCTNEKIEMSEVLNE